MQAKSRIMRSFSQASATYDKVADLQRQTGQALLSYLTALPLDPVVIDLGCGTGFLASELLNKPPIVDANVLAVDIALPMLRKAREKLNKYPVAFICADAEKLPIAEQSVDLVMSNLAIQWCQHPEQVLRDIHRILKPGGQLLLTTFGPQTLSELKTAWQQVDNHDHVNDFTSVETLKAYISNVGFTESALKTELHASSYSSVMALLYELKQLGAQTVLKRNNRSLTHRSKLNRMISAYPFSEVNGFIKASFEVITIIARA